MRLTSNEHQSVSRGRFGPAAPDESNWQLTVNADGVFVFWGAELEPIFGFSAADVIGRSADLLIPPVVRALHWRGFNRAMERGRMRRPDTVFRIVGLHKERRFVAFRSVDTLNIAEDGTVEGVTVTVLRHGWRSLLTRMKCAS